MRFSFSGGSAHVALVAAPQLSNALTGQCVYQLAATQPLTVRVLWRLLSCREVRHRACQSQQQTVTCSAEPV